MASNIEEPLRAQQDVDKHAAFEDLLHIWQKLNKPDELKEFLRDLCTPSEIEAMAERWRVARLVAQGQTYREISQKTGVSTATITRVARCVTYGKGYPIALQKGGLDHG